MKRKVEGILALLLVATLFLAPAAAGFVTPSKPGFSGNSLDYFTPVSPGNLPGYTAQWRSMDGINPNEPSTMADLASEIRNMRYGPSPQRPFSWTPSCII